MSGRKLKVSKDTVIGDLIEQYPAAEKVIEKHFGSGCFTCPGMKTESLDFGAMMHGMDVETVLRDVDEAIKEEE